MSVNNEPCENTDREIWRCPDDGNGSYYADSLHITKVGGLGINCGGSVYVKPIREWHRLAGGIHVGLLPKTAPAHDSKTDAVTDEMVERAWAAIVGLDVAGQCFVASLTRADLRVGLSAALRAPAHSSDAGEIARLRACIEAVRQATIEGRVCDDVAWFDTITTLHDYCEQALDAGQRLPRCDAGSAGVVAWQCRNIGKNGTPYTPWYLSDKPKPGDTDWDGYFSYEYRPLYAAPPAPVGAQEALARIVNQWREEANRQTTVANKDCDVGDTDWMGHRESARIYSKCADEIAALSQPRATDGAVRAAVIEECAKVAEAEAQAFLAPQYASNQPFGSICERFACEEVAKAIRALAPNPAAGSAEQPRCTCQFVKDDYGAPQIKICETCSHPSAHCQSEAGQ